MYRRTRWNRVGIFVSHKSMVEIANPELIDMQGDGLGGHQGIHQVELDAIPTFTLIPAFLLSELKRAFEMGFLIYLPFVVIDLVVASLLTAMGTDSCIGTSCCETSHLRAGVCEHRARRDCAGLWTEC